MPPFGSEAGTPNEGNQLMSCGSVRNTTAQNIHFAKFPPISASGMDPWRRLRPANTRQIIAADGARSSINCMKSDISCGGAIFNSERKKGQAPSLPAAPARNVGLSDSSGALGNPILQQSGDTRDHQESDCREHPLGESTAHGKCSNGHECCAAGADGRDYVANPVDQV